MTKWLERERKRVASIIIIFIAILILGYGVFQYNKTQNEIGSHIETLTLSITNLDQRNIDLNNSLFTSEQLFQIAVVLIVLLIVLYAVNNRGKIKGVLAPGEEEVELYE